MPNTLNIWPSGEISPNIHGLFVNDSVHVQKNDKQIIFYHNFGPNSPQCRNALALVPDCSCDNGVNVSGRVNEVIVLSAALTNETREAGIAGQIVTYGLPKPLERTRKKKKTSETITREVRTCGSKEWPYIGHLPMKNKY